MPTGVVKAVFVAADNQSDMSEVQDVQAVAGQGLVGDRYHDGAGSFSKPEPTPDREITLIEVEQVTKFCEEQGVELTPAQTRRNVLTEGIDLNALAGKTFRVGDVTLKGIRLCEPCKYLASKTYESILPGLVGRGGLRAQIVEGGTIRVGDAIEEIVEEAV